MSRGVKCLNELFKSAWGCIFILCHVEACFVFVSRLQNAYLFTLS